LSLPKLKLSTVDVLDALGYDHYDFSSPRVEPNYSEKKFRDLLPKIEQSELPRCKAIAARWLYSHQVEGLRVLQEGRNLALKSGTGSGKTETWFLFAALNDVKTLAVYPTLALANDQLSRLQEYTAAIGKNVLALDASKRDSMLKSMTFRDLRSKANEADIIVTNPAFLLNETKKMGAGRPALLKQFLEQASLLVVDDFDFYGPRSVALLFSMVKILVQHVNPKMQLCFMTAVLENPEEISAYLTSINGRRTEIVEGMAFHPPNQTSLVLGRSLVKSWEELRRHSASFRGAGVASDVLKALDDFQLFKKNYFKVMDVAKAAGIIVPDERADIADILSKYAEDDGLTLVFTRGIARAEELAKKIADRLANDIVVSAHHHLLSKGQRAETEERARRGEVKILISPRTLSQGIDIGLVKRVVHIGLPDSVREFHQREGRKGRRPEMELTETVIIPEGMWDRDLLSKGVETFRRWIELPPEKVIVNKENLYSTLFETLFSFNSPSLRPKLTPDQYHFLRRLKLESDGELTHTGKMSWVKMNFYEFAPPYGIKRLRTAETGNIYRLEDISHVDLVEKFQPGCIDYSSDGVVVEHRLGGSSYRVVTGVVLDDVAERVLRRHDALAYVLEEYERTKARWGEPPNLRRDYFNGKVHSEVMCVVHAPSQGFGMYTKIPNRVEWRLLAERKRIQPVGDRTLVYRERRSLEVPTPTYGMYADYTYGVSFEVDPRESHELLRLGLALVVILLRRLLRIPLKLIKYDIMILGERKVVSLHETESAGLLERMDWAWLADRASRYQPDELDEIFLEEIDELAYSSLVSLGLDWETVRKQAINVLNYLNLRERLSIKLGGVMLTVPKPSRALRIVSIAVADLTLREDLRSGIYGVSIFDGETLKHAVGAKELGEPDQEVAGILSAVAGMVDQGFMIATYDRHTLLRAVEAAGLSGLRALLLGAEEMGRLLEVGPLLSELLKEKAPLEEVEKSLGLERQVELKDIIYSLEEEKRRIPGMRFIRDLPERLSQRLMDFLGSDAKNVYVAALIAKSFQDKWGSER